MPSQGIPEMSTHESDLCLIGNLVVDDIYEIKDWPREGTSNRFGAHRQSVGGIGNMVEALDGSNVSISACAVVGNDQNAVVVRKYLKDRGTGMLLKTSMLPTSHAIILSSISSKERTSFVSWGCGKLPVDSFRCSKWAHIAYLDMVYETNIGNIESEILSADLCLSNPNYETMSAVLDRIGLLDFLFVSLSEVKAYAKDEEPLETTLERIRCDYGPKCIVCHERTRTLIVDEVTTIVNGTHEIFEADVLGAGDAYCANFILYQLRHGNTPTGAAAFAHEEASRFLKKRVLR